MEKPLEKPCGTTRAFTRRQFLSATAAGLGLPFGCKLAAAQKPDLWQAGLARIRITPERPVWMGGYGARTKPCSGVILDLHAKALALVDQAGKPAVLVTTDIIGFPAVMSNEIARRAEAQYGLTRDRLLLNSSHTHSGPVMASPYQITYKALMSEAQWRDVENYSRRLVDMIVTVIGGALKDLRPARLGFGHGEAPFGGNRRLKTKNGYTNAQNPAGLTDHDVPVLRVESPDGALRAVVFGYACHNTTLGADNYRICGDYAGFAQASLEKQHPGAMAFFVIGCAGDTNPYPRGTVALATRHGEELAGAVDKVLAGAPLAPVRGPLRTAIDVFPLQFAPPPTREALQAGLKDKNATTRRHAATLLATLDRGEPLISEYPYTVQVWQFGRDLTLIAMAGEVVVDYALRFKKEYGADRLWVAGYSNEVFAYIPSLRVLQEGGYEAGGAMTGTRFPGPWAPTIEDKITGRVHALVDRVRGEGD